MPRAMSYVGADAELLGDLRVAVGVTVGSLSLSRHRIAGLFAEAGEPGVVGPTLAGVVEGLGAAACEVGAAATVAAQDAAVGGQTGWRSRFGMVDDVALDVFWVNDVSRILTGRDLNTGTRVGVGGRAASA